MAVRSALQPFVLVMSVSAVTAVNTTAIADKLDAASIPTGAVYVCAEYDKKIMRVRVGP